ncbi:MAG: hypothetical protein KatS3mg076_2274 [Candidatus Binatia bacterium]|nr:MAG: hypothetical protein KatS3mg076_2274 [Candidatus Binatia bacterium]
MKGVARISFRGGALFVPVKTPYERELLFEHLDLYARRHGRVRLELNRKEWEVTLANGHAEQCTSCKRRLDTLTYALGNRRICAQCAKRDLR